MILAQWSSYTQRREELRKRYQCVEFSKVSSWELKPFTNSCFGCVCVCVCLLFFTNPWVLLHNILLVLCAHNPPFFSHICSPKLYCSCLYRWVGTRNVLRRLPIPKGSFDRWSRGDDFFPLLDKDFICVCVCERERERERETITGNQTVVMSIH